MLITLENLRNRASKRNINTTEWSDDEITALIMEAQSYIERVTGRIFDKQELQYNVFNFTGNSINLPHYPIISITEIKEDNNIIPSTKYRVNLETGIIYFNQPINVWSGYTGTDISIDYIAGYDPPDPVAASICTDLVLASIKYDITDLSSVKSLREGDLSITYKDDAGWLDFNSRLNSLKKPRIMMI